MKQQHVRSCIFSSWYNIFKEFTIKSYILQLPPEVLKYLNADGIVLPTGATNCLTPHTQNEDDEDEVEWDTDVTAAEAPSFPQFENEIRQAIKQLGGKVFPKLNWSAPRDASWMSFDGTLKCTCPSDIYLLLKSSDFITRDLHQPFIHCEDHEEGDEKTVTFELVMRKWRDLVPGMEFRCFVHNSKVIGVCQRYPSNYYPYLQNQKDTILTDITSFFHHIVLGKFPESQFVFDVYRRDQGKLWLLDFNPFGIVTDSLLYSWEELNNPDFQENSVSKGPELRIVLEDTGFATNPYLSYAVPKDFTDLSSGEDANKLIDFLKLKINQQDTEDSTSED